MNAPIVFIDDEPLLCRVFALALRPLGREVVTFTNPRAAVAYLASAERPCLVVCDYRMPGLTGLEVLAQVPQGVPFVLISGDLDAATTFGTRLGVTSFLAKPFRPDQLLAMVAGFVAAP